MGAGIATSAHCVRFLEVPDHKGHSFLCPTSGSPIQPGGLYGSPWYFGYPIRRCVTCVSPHLIFVFLVPTLPISSPVLRRAAYRIGDPAFPLFRAAFPFPVQLCIKAFLPDDLKVSWFLSRAKPNFASYPQAAQFAVDKIEDKISVQKDTAPMQCMEAVKNCPGARERGGVPPVQFCSAIACRRHPNTSASVMLQLRKDRGELHNLQLAPSCI